MADELKLLHQDGEGQRNPLALALLSLLVGAVAGLVGAIFRIGLEHLDKERKAWIMRAHDWGWTGIPAVMGAIAIAAAVAAWLVRRFSPEASGSGIPYVERQLREGWIGNPIYILLVKFFGGLLAIGGGLALGREGPSVQIGAGIGHWFLLFVIRFALGPVSYSAGTPGGLFAPMLTIGSGGGVLFGWLWTRFFPGGPQLPQECAIVGMAALFTSVVRAPITGITLIIELTASSELLLPLLVAAFAAMTVATVLKQPPIYSSLRVLR